MKRKYIPPTTRAVALASAASLLAGSDTKIPIDEDKEVDEQGAKQHGSLWDDDWSKPAPEKDEE